MTSASSTLQSRARTQGPCAQGVASMFLGEVHHVVDGSPDQIVRNIGTTALRRHYARLTLKAVQSVIVEGRFAFGDARAPSGRVPGLRRARNPLSVARGAHLVEYLRAGLRHG